MTSRPSGAPRTTWTALGESGSLAAIRIGAWVYRRFGRRVILTLLKPAALYFAIRRPEVRRASQRYLATLYALRDGPEALGRPPDTRATFLHIYEFAVSLVDRLVVWSGGVHDIEIDYEGEDAVLRCMEEGRGALLIGSHLGSFDMLRVLAARYGVRVNVVMYTRHAARINSFFEALDPESAARVIEIDPNSTRTVFDIRACIERGEFVALLADRVAPDHRERSLRTRFLGRLARFPLGPFLLAGTLGCPALMVACTRSGEARYHARVRRLGDVSSRVAPPEREKQARDLLERYVGWLEEDCLRAPLQWFNYYDFWADGVRDREGGERG